MALLPLAWCLVRGERRQAWWWIAGSFAVSWLADTAAHWGNPWPPAAVYPVSQAAIVGMVLLERWQAMLLATVLAVVGIVGVLWEGVLGPTVFLQTVAAGAVVWIVWPRPLGRLRVTLLTAFGGTALAWIGYVLMPGWTSWGAYQGVRAVSIALFCWASRERRYVRLA